MNNETPIVHQSARIHPQDERIFKETAKLLVRYRTSIIFFIESQWGLTPQKVKPEYESKWLEVVRSTHETWEALKNSVKPEWFGDFNETTQEWNWYHFEKGKSITWQQTLILLGVQKASNSKGKKNISVVSGHGIGKSATCSWIILWFLYVFEGAQVPVTAPTSHQMHDVLWKELSLWIGKMKEESRLMYEWTAGYIRMAYDPDVWFARARTSTKENTEAIAGVHADHVCIVVDEASGVPDQVFNTAEGALTSGNVLVILISNGTQTTGYFFDSHHKNKDDWQNFSFNCEQSPIVSRKYVERQAKRHGKDSDEYKIRVKGGFPGENAMDMSGYMQLVHDSKVSVLPILGDIPWLGRKILGVDPSGEGKDKCTFWLRDRFSSKCILELKTTNPREIAKHIIIFIERYGIDPNDVVVDSFGVGADVGKEVALASLGKYEIYTVQVGNKPEYEETLNPMFFRRREEEMDDNKKDLFLNIRALMFFRARNWLYRGGVIYDGNPENSEPKHEFLSIKYKRTLQGNTIQLMSKKEMMKDGIKSPNHADAISLTMLRDLDEGRQSDEERAIIEHEDNYVDNPYSVV